MNESRSPREPLVAVVVVHGDDAEAVYRSVDAMSAGLDDELAIEVVIVEDGEPELVRPRLGAGVLRVRTRDSPRGRTAAANEGAACTRAPFVLFLDPSVSATRADVACLLGRLRSDGRLAAVAPRLVGVRDAPLLERFRARVTGALPAEFARLARFERTPSTVRVARLLDAALLVRADVFRAVGGFDETCFDAAAEDWCRRVRRRGYEVALISDVAVASGVCPASVASSRCGYEVVRARARVLARHFGPARAFAFGCVAIACLRVVRFLEALVDRASVPLGRLEGRRGRHARMSASGTRRRPRSGRPLSAR